MTEPTTREGKRLNHAQKPVFHLWKPQLVLLWVHHAASPNRALDRMVQIMCMGVGVKLNSNLKMEMLQESTISKDLFQLTVWKSNMGDENTGFFHLIGLIGLLKTRLLMSLNILIGIVTFQEEKIRFKIPQVRLLAHGAILARIRLQE